MNEAYRGYAPLMIIDHTTNLFSSREGKALHTVVLSPGLAADATSALYVS